MNVTSVIKFKINRKIPKQCLLSVSFGILYFSCFLSEDGFNYRSVSPFHMYVFYGLGSIENPRTVVATIYWEFKLFAEKSTRTKIVRV